MANIDNRIIKQIQDVDESDLQYLLFESDCALFNAESDLIAISEEGSLSQIEHSLKVQVSSDCFISGINISSINEVNYLDTSVDKTLTNSEEIIEKSSNNNSVIILDDSNDKTLTNSEEITVKTSRNDSVIILDDSNDKTLTNSIEIKKLSLEVTLINDINSENDNEIAETSLLQKNTNFQGSSKDFSLDGFKENFTVILDNTTRAIERTSDFLQKQEPELTDDEDIIEEKQVQVKQLNNMATKTNEVKQLNDMATKTNEIKQLNIINNNTDPVCKNTQKITLKRPLENPEVNHTVKKIKDKNQNEIKINENISFDGSTATEFQFTKLIFDPDETADANDPKWSELKYLKTNEDYFNSVRNQWRSLSLPNPHKNVTHRFVSKDKMIKKPEGASSQKREHTVMSCVRFFDEKVRKLNRYINELHVNLNRGLRWHKPHWQLNKIHNDIENTQKQVIEIVKNQEEIIQNYKFYKNELFNANYLTKTELNELQEQDNVLEFQKHFYK